MGSSSSSLFANDKHVLITGGSKGLGRALAVELAVKHRARVTVLARGKSELESVCSEIAAQEGSCFFVVCDVTDYASCSAAVAAAEAKFGPVEWLFCCAGVALTGRLLERPVEDFERQIRLNYMGTVHFVKLCVPGMMERRRGKIILCSSQAGLMSAVGYAAYAPTKYAVRGLGDGLRNELLPHKVDVHILFPGNMNSPGYAEEQLTKPDECKAIESGEALQEPADVAKASLRSVFKGEYQIYGGNFSGFLLGRMAQGISPRNTPFLDVLLAPFLVIIAWYIRVFVVDKAALARRAE